MTNITESITRIEKTARKLGWIDAINYMMTAGFISGDNASIAIMEIEFYGDSND